MGCIISPQSNYDDCCYDKLWPLESIEKISLKGLVERYNRNNKKNFDYLKTLNTTVEFILGRENPGYVPGNRRSKRHPHQCLLSYNSVDNAIKALDNIPVVNDFDELHSEVSKIINKVNDAAKDRKEARISFGNLTIYDFCLRKGYKMGIEPTKTVYFHAGAYRGAHSLIEMGMAEFDLKAMHADREKFPKELLVLNSTRIEDFLCVEHDNLLLFENYYRACRGKKPRYDCYTEHQAQQKNHAKEMRKAIDSIFAKVKPIK